MTTIAQIVVVITHAHNRAADFVAVAEHLVVNAEVLVLAEIVHTGIEGTPEAVVAIFVDFAFYDPCRVG